MMNTTMAQAASVFRSAVGLHRPTTLIRLQPMLSAKIAPTSGMNLSKCQPMLSWTNWSSRSTMNSAAACRLETFSSLRSRPSQKARAESSAMTIHVLTRVWVILKSPSTGILVWMVYRIFAPFSSICYVSPPFSSGADCCASAGSGSSSTETSTGSAFGVSGLYLPVICR